MGLSTEKGQASQDHKLSIKSLPAWQDIARHPVHAHVSPITVIGLVDSGLQLQTDHSENPHRSQQDWDTITCRASTI